MKRTTYIIIGLIVLPFVLVFVGACMLRFFGEKWESDTWIEASESTPVVELPVPAFYKIMLLGDGNAYIENSNGLDVVSDSTYSVSYPETWGEYISAEVADGVLRLSLGLPEGFKETYASLRGASVVVKVPKVASIGRESGGWSGALSVSGFNQKAMDVSYGYSNAFFACEIDSLSISSPRNEWRWTLSCTDSRLGSVNVAGCHNIDISTYGSGRIDTFAWAPRGDGYFETTINKANVGSFLWQPSDGQTIRFHTNKAATFTFDR